MVEEEKTIEFYPGFNKREDWKLFADVQSYLERTQKEFDGKRDQAINEILQQLVSVTHSLAHSTTNSRSEEAQNMEKFRHDLHKIIVGGRSLRPEPARELALIPMDRDLPESEPE